MNLLLILSAVAAVAIQSTHALVRNTCANPGDTFIVISHGVNDCARLAIAGDLKVSFLFKTDDLDEAKEFLEVLPEHSIVWKLSESDLERAQKHYKPRKNHKSSQEKLESLEEHTVGSLISKYEDLTENELKLVQLPSSSQKELIEAFEEKGIIVMKNSRKVSESNEVNSLLREAGESSGFKGGVLEFKVKKSKDVKKIIQLRDALKIVDAKECFPDMNQDEAEAEAEEVVTKMSGDDIVSELAVTSNETAEAINAVNANESGVAGSATIIAETNEANETAETEATGSVIAENAGSVIAETNEANETAETEAAGSVIAEANETTGYVIAENAQTLNSPESTDETLNVYQTTANEAPESEDSNSSAPAATHVRPDMTMETMEEVGSEEDEEEGEEEDNGEEEEVESSENSNEETETSENDEETESSANDEETEEAEGAAVTGTTGATVVEDTTETATDDDEI